MAWDLGFTARLGQAAEPVFLLEHVKLPEGVRGSIKACSHSGFGAPEIIARPGPSVQGTSIRLREWKPAIGGFSVPIAAAGGRWLRQLKRGQIYELKIGFRGVSRFDFQTVAIGQVWNVSRRGIGPYRIVFRDFMAALASRFSRTAGEQALFYDLPVSTTLDSAYTPGDGTVTVVSTSGFERRSGSKGIIGVYPAGSDRFFLRWNAKTSTTFTVDSASNFNGTTQASASIGDAVQSVALLNESPIVNALRVLTSTGGATNGTYDTLPDSWGYGLPARMIDTADASRFDDQSSPDGGSSIAVWMVEEAQPNGLDWLTGRMSTTGFWLCLRQGQITARGAMPNGYGTFSTLSRSGLPAAKSIGDAQIVSLDAWDAWDPSVPVEYRRVRVEGSENGSVGGRTTSYRSENITGYPSRDAYTIDTTDENFGSSFDDTAEGVRDRIAEWYLRTPIAMKLTVGGLRYAGLCPGDWVELTSEVVHGRLPTTADGYEARRCMVTQVSPDWTRGTVQLGLAVTSDRQDDYA